MPSVDQSQPPTHSSSKVHMNELTYEEMLKVLYTLNMDDPSLDNTDMYISWDDAYGILSKTISTYYISNSLKKQGTTADFRSTNTFFSRA